MSLSKWLRTYGDSLAPSEQQRGKAGEVIDRIHQVIHCHLGDRFSIDRIRPLGSYSKKTSIWFKMDIDIIIYLNNERPPFERFKRELDDVATMQLDENCKETPLGINLRVDGFEVDLLPAENFLYNAGYHGKEDEAEVQTRNVLQYLRESPRARGGNKMLYSTSLSEGAVKFAQLHSAFSHSISRLAKMWNLTIGIPGFSFGRSSIMEYLGARAAEEEESRESPDALNGFRGFLQMIECARNLNVFWTIFYQERDIPLNIRQQRPLLLDPTNPYNNMLDDGLGKYLMMMSPHASETLRRLEDAEWNNGYPYEEIFRPQPDWVRIFGNPTSQKMPKEYLIGHRQSSLSIPKIETRSGAKGVDHKIAESYLFAFTDAVSAAAKRRDGVGETPRVQDDITDHVKSKLQKFISPTSNWTSSDESHDSKDMTFTIPLGKDANQVIEISCNWR